MPEEGAQGGQQGQEAGKLPCTRAGSSAHGLTVPPQLEQARKAKNKLAAAAFGPPGPKTQKRRLSKRTKQLKKQEAKVAAKTAADRQKIAKLKKKERVVKDRMKGISKKLAKVVKVSLAVRKTRDFLSC